MIGICRGDKMGFYERLNETDGVGVGIVVVHNDRGAGGGKVLSGPSLSFGRS